MNTHAIFGTDLSPASDKLIECAFNYKNLGIARITLVHALGLKHIQAFEDMLRQGVEEKLGMQKKKLEEQDFEVDTRVVKHLPKDEFRSLAKDIDAALIIIGTHGISLTKALIGSTATELLHNITHPLLLMALKTVETDDGKKEELFCRKLTGRILFPTDFSDTAEAAFQWIKNREAPLPKLTLLHVQDEVKIGKYLKDKLEEFNRIDGERLGRLKKSFNEAHPETDIEIVIDYGKPRKVILNYIKENEVCLTVMGSQGRGYIPEFFLGSVSHQVARNSGSNVLFVPLPGKQKN